METPKTQREKLIAEINALEEESTIANLTQRRDALKVALNPQPLKESKIDRYTKHGYPYPYYSIDKLEAFVLEDSVNDSQDIFLAKLGKAGERIEAFSIPKANLVDFIRKTSMMLNLPKS